MKRFHAYLMSDAPGAAHAFAGILLGGTFAGIVTLSAVVLAVVEAVR